MALVQPDSSSVPLYTGGISDKRILLLSSMIPLSAVCAVGQNDSDSDSESKTTSSRMFVEECLDGATGNYTLTDRWHFMNAPGAQKN